jgi:hypothetical protein
VREVELQEALVEQLGLHALLDEERKVVGVPRRHVGMQHLFAEDLAADRVEQQTGGRAGVAGSFSISVRAARIAALCTSSIGTPSYRLRFVSARIGAACTSAPSPAHADSMMVCSRRRSSGTR